ncbi:hypothetical protein DID77_03700 [Candidatus Marinamargulisbacteria bacterium SCGC AG-439-L15]|nr:hypothetical protein DID77_03700 [Candidatus Marinamargulisbacteria bacterium SCGC AG-439-L15]
MTIKKTIAIIVIVLISVIGPFSLRNTPFITDLEHKTFDLRAKLSYDSSTSNSDIVLILIDESSLQAMMPIVGRWPWPRSIYAELLNFLSDAGAKAVLIDILFTETQDARSENQTLGFDDQVFVQATQDNGAVFNAFQLLYDIEEAELNIKTPLPATFIQRFSVPNIQDPHNLYRSKANKFYLPFDELWQHSYGMGVVEIKPDPDGIYRRIKLFRDYQGHLYPAIAMGVLLQQLNPQSIILDKKQLKLDDLQIPHLKTGEYLFVMKKNFESYSAGGVLATIQDLAEGNFDNLLVPPSLFENKTVFIGASAVGTYDLKNTSLGANIPGVFIHASVLDNILKKEFYREVPLIYTEITITIICLLISFVILQSARVTIQLAPSIIGLFGYNIISLLIFKQYLLLTLIISANASIGICILSSFGYVAVTEGKARRKVRKMLSQYVSPSVLTEVMDKKSNTLTPEIGAKEELSIFFSDIRSFTSISEKTSPEQTVEMLNYYLDKMVGVVFEYKGTLDKFIGDAVMAFWGAPVINKNHATDAVMCALQMRESLKEVNEHFASKGYDPFKIGMGINTGPVILGNIGSEKKLDYTVIGDNVNLGSRIEGLTKPYGCDVLISEFTHKQLDTKIPSRVVDLVRVKGKEKPIKIFNPLLSLNSSSSLLTKAKQTEALFDEAFDAFVSKKFKKSLKLYSGYQKENPDDIIPQLFIDRCTDYLKNPPPDDWDGCQTLKTK